MWERKISMIITNWIESFLSTRIIKLKFNNIIIEIFEISIEISQEFSLSSILYIIYNNLFNISNQDKLELRFINDIIFEIKETIIINNILKLKRILIKIKIW